MRALVVHAHPDPSSYSRALRDAAVRGLERAGHHVDVLDLYAIDFAAAMSRNERLAYETESPILDPMVAEHAELVRSADALVFVYPTWMWGLPAVMKGWLERVLVTGVAFRLDERSGRVKPGLRHVRRIVGITTYDVSRLSMRLFHDAGRRVILRCLRVLSPTLRCRTRWFGLYSMPETSAADREGFLAEVEQGLASL